MIFFFFVWGGAWWRRLTRVNQINSSSTSVCSTLFFFLSRRESQFASSKGSRSAALQLSPPGSLAVQQLCDCVLFFSFILFAF